jgi:monothiol glutaredoxin
MEDNALFDRIRNDIATNDIVLYMKGTPAFPQDGFSAAVVQVLDNFGVSYIGIDVLQDRALHTAVKEFANWPNVPQLYIKGKFVGGSDIVKELSASGELHQMLEYNDLLP